MFLPELNGRNVNRKKRVQIGSGEKLRNGEFVKGVNRVRVLQFFGCFDES